jgi:predicted nucleotidyltransferase
VQPFGSYVSGLGTKDSDIDIVITGITEPLPGAGFYESYARPGVARILDRAASALYRAPQLR